MISARLFMLALVFSLTTACTFSAKKTEPKCVYADGSNLPAPQWVCNKNPQEDSLFAVAYADKSATGTNFMQQMAERAAKNKLMQALETKINNKIKRYAKSANLDADDALKKITNQTNKLINRESLTDSQVLQQRMTPTGGMVVALRINKKETLATIRRVLKTSINTNSLLWRPLQTNHSPEELLEAILQQP